MDMKKLYTAFTSLLVLLAYVEAQLDITKYGVRPNGNQDISQALTSAWKEACAATSPTTIIIPSGTYALNQAFEFAGPCKAPIKIQLQGIIKASPDPSKYQGENVGWVTFTNIQNFVLAGGGTFDGQGATAWTKNDCQSTGKCSKLPANLRFNFLSNSTIQDITSKDSKLFHVAILGAKNVTFQRFTIDAPDHSLNTDGIHVGRSNGVNITDSHIRTGDDCISIGDGSQQVSISKVTCGPGHGISVGSLGKYPNEEPVVGIYVNNCTITNTMNGVRVKTWPASPEGVASDMHFEDIIMQNVSNPVLIDQQYCPFNKCTLEKPSRVKISKVSFKKIRGTSATQLAVKLVCSQSLPCTDVEVGDIDLTYNGPEGPATAQCANVQPKFSGTMNPASCTAPAQSS